MDLVSLPFDEDQFRRRAAQLAQELRIPSDYEKRGLPFHCGARELVFIEQNKLGFEIFMEPQTAASWQKMKDMARVEGIELLVETAYRSLDQQADIIRNELAAGRSLESALSWIAAPGYSEHHTGRALDIGSPDCFPIPPTDEFEGTMAFKWLAANAARFGFVLSYPRDNSYGIIYEPWHWCYRDEMRRSFAVSENFSE